jgi:DNA polymerase-4
MHENGIFTGLDLKQRTENELVRLFGKMGHDFYLYARGIDNREVDKNRITKSISNETTFLQDKNNRVLLTVELYHLAKAVFSRIEEENFHGKTITIKIKYADFKVITRSKTLPQKITAFQQFWHIAREMMKQIDLSGQPVRLIGFGISNAEDKLSPKHRQLELF